MLFYGTKIFYFFILFQHKNLNVESKLPDGYCCLLTNSHIVLYNFPHTITDSMLLVNMDSLKLSPSPSHYYVVIVSMISTFSFKINNFYKLKYL